MMSSSRESATTEHVVDDATNDLHMHAYHMSACTLPLKAFLHHLLTPHQLSLLSLSPFLSPFPSQAEICLTLPFLGKFFHLKFKYEDNSKIHTPPCVASPWISDSTGQLSSFPLYLATPGGPGSSHFCTQTLDCLYPAGVSATVESLICYIPVIPTLPSSLLWVHNTPFLPSSAY